MIEPLRTASREGVLTITINRPGVRNALDHATAQELLRTLQDAAGAPGITGVVLTGADGAFCSGDDLDEAAEADVVTFRAQIECLQELTKAIRGLDVPVVAAIDGPAYGGGLELAVSCDARIASDRARFACPEPAWGLTLTNGASVLLPRLVGDGWTRELTMFGRVLDAGTAERIGLVTRVVSAPELLEAAQEMAARTGRFSARAMSATKELVGTDSALLSNTLHAETEAAVAAFDTNFTRDRLREFQSRAWRGNGVGSA